MGGQRVVGRFPLGAGREGGFQIEWREVSGSCRIPRATGLLHEVSFKAP